MFLTEFCRTLGVPIPDPAGAITKDNGYVRPRSIPNGVTDQSPYGLPRVTVTIGSKRNSQR
jgi:hypothetical protein